MEKNFGYGEFSDGVLIDVSLATEVPGITEPLITVDDLEIVVGVQLFTLTADVTVDAEVTVHNPLFFEISVVNFTGDIEYDPASGGAKTYLIFLELATDGSLGYPEPIAAESEILDDISLGPVSIDYALGAEMIADDVTNGYILVDITSGILQVEIGAFSIQIENIILEDIQVAIL